MRRQLKYIIVSWIFGVISACTRPEVCFPTEQLNCNSEKLCEHGDCYRATKSVTIDSETVDSIKNCPQGFDNYKEYCFKVDYEKKSWTEASHDSINGDLVDLLTREDAKISAEYLRIKLTDTQIGVWTSGRVDMTSSNLLWSGNKALVWYGSNTFSRLFPLHDNTCLAVRSNNYTYWDLVNCETQLISLRSADAMTGNDFMCWCDSGYTGKTCNSIISASDIRYELQNPQSIECAPKTVIFIEFALYEYRANGSSSTVCAAPNTLAFLRYLCQGKSSCTLEPSVLKSYFSYVCDEILNAFLTVQYSCLPSNETICPSEMTLTNEFAWRNCLLITHVKATWNETFKFCEAHGGQLAALYDLNKTFIAYLMETKNVTNFWYFGQRSELRPNTRRPDVCTKAVIDSKADYTNYITVITECSGNLPGLCAFPPFRPDVIHNRSALLQPTLDDPTEDPKPKLDIYDPRLPILENELTTTIIVDTTIDVKVDDPTTEPKVEYLTTETTVDDTTIETKVDDPRTALLTGKYCPAQSYGGLNWPSVIQRANVILHCPPGQNGSVSWTCNANGEYNPIGPDFHECVTPVTTDIDRLSHKLGEGQHSDVVVRVLAETLHTAETIASGDLLSAINLIDQAIDVQRGIVHNITDDGDREETMNNFTSGVMNATSVVLATHCLTMWFGLNTIDRAETATKLLADVDSTGILHASVLTSATRTTFKFNGTLHLYIEARNTTDTSLLELPNIIVPPEAFQIVNRSDSTGTISIVVATYNTIGRIMPIGDHFQIFTNVTQVIGATLNEKIQLTHDRVSVTIEKPTGITSLNQSLCVFWNESDSQWSTNGCELSNKTNATHFVCNCDHMTNFAVLMSFNTEQVKIMALNVITITGCSISIICLAACIITFLVVRSIRNLCYKVHLHLCISLMIADTILITAYYYKAYNADVDEYCTVLAMLLHYFYLATFMWMVLEGVQLYIFLVKVFAQVRNYGYMYFLVGYGIPGLVVGISASVNIEGYASATDCFLDTESGFIWGFIAFVLATLIFNTVLLFRSLQSASRLKHMRTEKQTESAKQWLWQIIILHPLLGFTWFFGLLQFGDQLVFSYVFTILNSLQGLFIFLFHFFRNKNVRHYFSRIYLSCDANDADTKRITRTPATSSSGQTEDSERRYIVKNRKLGPHWKKVIHMDRITSGHTDTDLNETVVLHSVHAIDRYFIDT